MTLVQLAPASLVTHRWPSSVPAHSTSGVRGDSPSAVMLPFGERVMSGEIGLRSSPFLTLRYTNWPPQ